jgi:hypothetical protein
MMKKKLIKATSKVTQTHLHEGSTKLAEQGADRHNHRYWKALKGKKGVCIPCYLFCN